jgi:hypothetical protein
MESWSVARVEISAQVPSCAVHLVGEKNSKTRRGPASGWWDSGIRYCKYKFVCMYCMYLLEGRATGPHVGAVLAFHPHS